MSFEKAFRDAKAHARQVYPAESCGLIAGDSYIACDNVAKPSSEHVENDDNCGCQLCSFRIDASMMIAYHGKIQMIIHSHPGGPIYPSAADAEGQIASNLPWALIALDESRISEPLIWGCDTPMAPILGREFNHYTADCYTLIRDCYALGRDALAQQKIEDWPYPPIKLPEFPREDGWWNGEKDFYETEPFKIGFKEIPMSEAKSGDVFLMAIRSEKMNHGGLLLGNNLILHHLPNRLSRREPAGIWARQVKRWLRYTGDITNA